MSEILIDMGGTFTDGVLIHDDGRITISKSESDPSDPANAIFRCIAGLATECQLEIEGLLAQTRTILIGTTLATNCILESKGAKCCLIHTKGFRDVFELGRTISKNRHLQFEGRRSQSADPSLSTLRRRGARAVQRRGSYSFE